MFLFARKSEEDELRDTVESLFRVVNESVELCNYIEVNITAVRKILKKFDKKQKEFGFKDLSVHYLRARITSDH